MESPYVQKTTIQSSKGTHEPQSNAVKKGTCDYTVMDVFYGNFVVISPEHCKVLERIFMKRIGDHAETISVIMEVEELCIYFAPVAGLKPVNQCEVGTDLGSAVVFVGALMDSTKSWHKMSKTEIQKAISEVDGRGLRLGNLAEGARAHFTLIHIVAAAASEIAF